MANIKSAKKRILVNRTKADRNKAIKSGVKTAIKKVYTAVEANDKEAAAAALLNATSVIDKLHKRRISQELCFQKSFSFIQGCKPDGLGFAYIAAQFHSASVCIKNNNPYRHVGCW